MFFFSLPCLSSLHSFSRPPGATFPLGSTFHARKHWFWQRGKQLAPKVGGSSRTITLKGMLSLRATLNKNTMVFIKVFPRFLCGNRAMRQAIAQQLNTSTQLHTQDSREKKAPGGQFLGCLNVYPSFTLEEITRFKVQSASKEHEESELARCPF